MKYLLAVALQLLIVGSVNAHCYSIWNYPKPQPCGRGGIGRHTTLKMSEPSAMQVQPLPSAPDDEIPDARIWYVEITKLPPLDEREEGIKKLKEQMNK